MIWFFPKIETARTDDFPLFACLIAVIWALFTFKEKLTLNKKIEIFVSGTAQPTIIYMCFIFIFSSIFAHFLTLIKGVDAVVNLSLLLVPSSLLLPGIFVTVSLFSLTIGSSMGSITAFMPIAIGFTKYLGINPALMAGIVVGGSMLGDNLSLISDTTIAAVKTTGCAMSDKFKENVKLVLPAFVATVITLFFVNRGMGFVSAVPTKTLISYLDFIKIVPYIVVITLALLGIDVLGVLILGTFTAVGIGLFDGSFSYLHALTNIFDGFYTSKKMVAVFVIVMLIAGLSKMIEANGGLNYLIERSWKRIKSKAGAETSIAFIIFLVNAVLAINTISILVVGPIAKRIGKKFDVSNKRIASLLDIFACVCQGIVPYAPQLLLAGALANISSIAIMPYLHYQFFIFIVAVVSILSKIFVKKNTA